MTIKTTVETITPEIAAEYLKHNTRNRNKKLRAIDIYTRQMADGRWRLNGESIKFASTGVLLDGQNRLLACIRANVPFETNVVRGLDESVFDTLDQQAKRTAGDALHLAGIKNSNRTATTLRFAKIFESGSRSTSAQFSPAELLEAYDEHPLVETVVSLSTTKKAPIFDGPVLAVILLATERSEERGFDFLDALATGEALERGSPVLMLRNRLMTDGIKIPYIKLGLTARAWNAFYSRRSLGVLKFSASDQLPELLPTRHGR